MPLKSLRVSALSRRRVISICFLIAAVVAGSAARAGAVGQPAVAGVSGLVLDASGAPVPGARVFIEPAGASGAETVTGADGRFVLQVSAAEGAAVIAVAPGFAESRVLVVEAGVSLRIVLQPARLGETVTVTASRSVEPLTTPESTTVLSSAALLNAAAGRVDDALRSTPGFSLFRRSSSRVANPSTQGATLRGLSASGASRTLVLADGLALNDPFGTWVYWNRVPQVAIERIEVVRGAAGDLYGADALGGVIQVVTFGADRTRLRAAVEGGSHATGRGSLFASGSRNGWALSAAGEIERTDGVYIVASEDRGTADTRADSDYEVGTVTAGYTAGAWRTQVRGSVYREARGNGTKLQVNDTDWRQLVGEASGVAGGGAWLARASYGTQDYFNSFSAVAANRNSERLTSDQRIPTESGTWAGQWARPFGPHAILIGTEGRHTKSTMYERRYSLTGVPSGPFVTGGSENSGSLFGRASLAAGSRVTVSLGLRGDFWRSTPLDTALPTQSLSFFSPRASVAWTISPAVSVRGAAYRASRTPTLNELHRGFRVGNTVTNGNPLLEPERLVGFEGGVLFGSGRASARVTGFWNRLDDAIANITIRSTPALITREKQNADRLRAAGVEVEADFRLSSELTIGALGVFTSSRFTDTPKQPDIEGNRVPQVPGWQLGGNVTYTDPRIATVTAQVRVAGDQYDDDRNQFLLDGYAVVDAYASRALGRGVQAYIALENLFDAEYDVGRTPVRTVGWPRTVRAGLRVFIP